MPAAMGQGSEAFVAKIPGASMTSSVMLQAEDATGTLGQTLEMPIRLTRKGTAAPATFQIDLSFNQQKLAFVSVRAGEQVSTANKVVSFSVMPNGDVRLLTTGMNQTVIADGMVAYASFTVQGSFLSGSTPVTPSNCLSAVTTGSALATGCNGGSIYVLACDLNLDGATTVTDVQLIVYEALGLSPNSHDLNQDGAVNVVDVQKILNAAFGLGCVL